MIYYYNQGTWTSANTAINPSKKGVDFLITYDGGMPATQLRPKELVMEIFHYANTGYEVNLKITKSILVNHYAKKLGVEVRDLTMHSGENLE
jgi:hypothetical protein